MKNKRNPQGTEEQAFTTLIESSKPDLTPKNLRAIRRSLNMTQKELAKRAGVTQSSVSAFEHGDERNVSADARARIAGVLVQAEFDYRSGSDREPTQAEQIHKLKVQLFIAQRNEKAARTYASHLEAEQAVKDMEIAELKKLRDRLLDLLDVKQKAVMTQADFDTKLDEVGLEKKIPNEEALRSEIMSRGKGKA